MTEPHRATEVTIGEVYRLTLRIDSRLDQITRDMVGREEYESDQEGVRERIEALAAGLADERKAREAAIREQATKSEQARRYALTTAVSVAVLVLGVLWFLLDLGGGPA